MKKKHFIPRHDARVALAAVGLACATLAPAGAQTLNLNGSNVLVDTLNGYTRSRITAVSRRS